MLPNDPSPSDIKGGVLFVAKKPNNPQDEPAGFGGRTHLPGASLPWLTAVPDFDKVV